jgi:hypothetical protein
MIVRKNTSAANRWPAAFLMCAFSVATVAGRPQPLDARVYAKELPAAGIVTFSVNWGRKWGCAGAENAQLQRLAFSRLPVDPASAVLDLKTPSKLFVDDRFISYSYVLEPGTYAISAFDVKVAKSKREVGHLLGTTQELMQDGTAVSVRGILASAVQIVLHDDVRRAVFTSGRGRASGKMNPKSRD